MPDFTGKAALITGAGGQHGIGRAVALRLAGDGADVIVSDIVERPYPKQTPAFGGLPQTVEEIRASGRRAGAVLADVTVSSQVQHLVDETLGQLGRLDIFVHCAGHIPGPDRVPVVDLEEDIWNAVQRINVTGTFLCCRAVARAMIDGGDGGRIITLSSVSGKKGAARFAAYCASKFAIVGFTQALALELAPHRITANAICPTFVDTERMTHIAGGLAPAGVTAEAQLDRMIEEFNASIPMGRIGWPADVAGAAAYLASEEAGFITGTSLTVAGGGLLT